MDPASRDEGGEAESGGCGKRRSDAKVVLDRYRGPLLEAAWQLGDRLDSIRYRGFLAYLSEGSCREQDAKLTALFRLAHYFGWREFVRTQVQLLRFQNEEDTRWQPGSSMMSLRCSLATYWTGSGRCCGATSIGELMTTQMSGGSSIVRGSAAFYRNYDKAFALWMERLLVTCSRVPLSIAIVCGSCNGRCTGSSGGWTRRAPMAAVGSTGAHLRSSKRHSTEVSRSMKNS